jgi:hypothetical protein
MKTGILYVLDTNLLPFNENSDESEICFSAALRQLVCAKMPICYVTIWENPAFFLKPEVTALLDDRVDDVFPLTVRDFAVLKKGSFPTEEELERWLNTKLLPLSLDKEKEIITLVEKGRNAFSPCCSGCGGCHGELAGAGC